MGGDKHSSKSGAGYVGGFFQLFDWNARSRKKLFSNKSDISVRSKGKRGDGSFPVSRLHLSGGDDFVTGSSVKGSDYSCSSSVTDDDGYGTRAPGLVARLMGLDSLPTSNADEPYSSPLFDSQSLGEPHYRRKNVDIQNEHHVLYPGELLKDMDGPSRRTVETKPRRLPNRPIEKFQTEILPPKSAKSIPATHHKLLSPIKGPGFIPSKNAVHIMEAAAKIIEQGPQTTRAKISSTGPTVPFRVRDLKEKLEGPSRSSRLAQTSRRPNESNAAKCLKGQSLNKSWDGPVDTPFRVFSDAEENSTASTTTGKSISLAVQAKVNVQRREGLTSTSNRSSVGQREQGEVRLNHSFNSQQNVHKTLQKKSSARNTSSALRQNNQKQNCLDRNKSSTRSSASNLQGRKTVSVDSSVGRHKPISKSTEQVKVGSRKLSSEITCSEKGVPYSRIRNPPRKKRSIDGDVQFQRGHFADAPLINKSEKPAQYNPVADRKEHLFEESQKKGMDVVSFTFTAPMTRSTSASESCSQASEKNKGVFPDRQGKRMLVDSDTTKLSTLKYNVIGGDALSVLLEQKLKELTYGVESARCNSTGVKSAANSTVNLRNLVTDANKGSVVPAFHNRRDYGGLLYDRFDSEFSSTEFLERKIRHKHEGVEETDQDSLGPVKSSSHLLDSRHPSPISTLEPFPTESCNSSDSIESNITEGSLHCSSVQAQEIISPSSFKVETETDLSDSASSTSVGTLARVNAVTVTNKNSTRTVSWELDYVNEVLCNLELMFTDFALGRAREILNPRLFELLEVRKGGSNGYGDQCRTGRKALFDCVGECLDLRCRRYVGGGSKAWGKGMELVRRKRFLADEVHKEISGWKGMGDCMVDELVDKDMSKQYGRWLDYEVEASELGADVESQILNSLVDEIVADILF